MTTATSSGDKYGVIWGKMAGAAGAQQSPYEFKNVESKTKEGVFKLLGPKIEDGTSTLKDSLSNAKDEDKVKIWKEYFRLIDTK